MTHGQKDRYTTASFSLRKQRKVSSGYGREHMTDHLTPTSLLPCFAFPDLVITFVRSFSYFNDSLPVLTLMLFEILKAYLFEPQTFNL